MQQLKYALPLVAAFALIGCSSSSSSSKDDTTGDTSNKFTKTATWTFEQTYSAANKTITQCFDFDTDLIVDCTGTAWDIKIEQGSNGSATPKFYTNSGTSATSENSQGAAMGSPFNYSWEKLTGFTDGNHDDEGATVPEMAFMADSIDNPFTDNFFVYDFDTFRMNPTYQVFLVTTDSTKKLTETISENTASTAFAVQATNYYGGSTGADSGYIKLRWVDVTESSTVNETTIDATSYDDWVYFDLKTGEPVLETSAANGDGEVWQLAFKRYDVKTNSGISKAVETTTVGAFKGTTPEELTDTAGLVALKNSANNWGWSSSGFGASNWTTDAIYSSLNPAFQGSFPNPLSFGFYTYYPTDAAGAEVGLTQHMLGANPENGVMLRSGDGDTYARMRITEIKYGEPSDETKPYNADRTYTLEFDVTE